MLFTIGSVVALLAGFFGDLIYIWITKGWLFISNQYKSWGLHITVEATIASLQAFSAVAAACGFVVYAARRPSSTLQAQMPQMEPASNLWSLPKIFGGVFAVIFVSAAVYYHVAHSQQEQQVHEWDIYLMSCKTDDLDADTFESHFREHYGDITIYSKQGVRGLSDEVSTFLKKKPGAKLFHYDTPEIVWRQLGGRRGYAIVYEAMIVWEIKMKQS
jgi:hypothetical protein